MKTAIIYKTIYGSTKKYADWLKADLKASLYDMDKVEVKKLEAYKRLIVMSGTYAAKMPLTNFLNKNWEALKSKEIVIVAVGAAPENNWWSKVSYWLIPGKIKKVIKKYFKLYGQYEGKGPEVKKADLKRVTDYLKK